MIRLGADIYHRVNDALPNVTLGHTSAFFAAGLLLTTQTLSPRCRPSVLLEAGAGDGDESCYTAPG